MQPSTWVRERFGSAAAALGPAVIEGILVAHEDAVAAQGASGTKKKDPYGHTMKNRQYEAVVEAARDIPGVRALRPRGAFFELVTVPETGTVLYPWRYATDGSVPRETARMRTSGFRVDLLGSAAPLDHQLTIDEAGLDLEELEARLLEEQAVLEELKKSLRVVLVGYASTTSRLLDLGWGEAALADQHGTLDWRHWESLPFAAARVARRSLHVLSDLRTEPVGTGPRFDDAPLEELVLPPRNSQPPAAAAEGYGRNGQGITGTEDEPR
ncbi:MAG TPA: hypothetical protein VFP72_06720 [Kineosporiaceae bacterium]|nr:hypothetical protein [Kineosporiaceae bacterium]